MWDHLISIRRCVWLSELFPFSPIGKGLEEDLSLVQNYYALHPRPAEPTTRVSTNDMNAFLAPIEKWLKHFCIIVSENGRQGFDGVEWTVPFHYGYVHGPSGFEPVFEQLQSMSWDKASDYMIVEMEGMDRIRAFAEKVKGNSDQFKAALSKNFSFKTSDYAHSWLEDVLNAEEDVERNVDAVLQEAKKRNIKMSHLQALLALQFNGIVLASADKTMLTMMQAYSQPPIEVKEVVVSSDAGKVRGAKVVASEKSSAAGSSAGPESDGKKSTVVLSQRYLKALLSKVYKWVIFVNKKQYLLSEEGLVAGMTRWRKAGGENQCCIEHLTTDNVGELRESLAKHSQDFLPYLCYDPIYRSSERLVIDENVIKEFLQGVIPKNGCPLQNYKNGFRAYSIESYAGANTIAQDVLAEIRKVYPAFSQQVLGNWEAKEILRDGIRKRGSILQVMQRVFLVPIADLIIRNGTIVYKVGDRKYAINFYKKNVEGGSVKACVVHDEAASETTAVTTTVELPFILGLGTEDTLDLIRFASIVRKRATTMGYRVNFGDDVLTPSEKKIFTTLDALATERAARKEGASMQETRA